MLSATDGYPMRISSTPAQLRLQQAYLNNARPVRSPQKATPPTQSQSPPEKVDRVDDTSSVDAAQVKLARMIAAVVPGRIDFSQDQPRQAGPSLPLYHHPADKNAAATGINLGRMLDISG